MKPGSEGSRRRFGTAALFGDRNGLGFGHGVAPAEARALWQGRCVSLGISGCNRRVVNWQVPFGPVLIRRHDIGRVTASLDIPVLELVKNVDYFFS